MIKELKEGPVAIKNTLESSKNIVNKIVEELSKRSIDKGFIIGSGTSFHASVALGFLLTKYTDYHFTPVPASEFEEWTPLVRKDYAIIGFSQSGESSDIIQAVKEAKDKGLFVIGITNTPGSSLTKLSDICIVTKAGEEKAVVATKTYDVQLAASSLLAYTLSSDKRAKDLLEKLFNADSIVEDVIRNEENNIKKVAEKYKNVEHLFILGHGVNFANAFEAGLKFKEAAMIHSEGFAVREFLHGPVQLVDKNAPVIVLLPTKEALEGSMKAIDKVRSYNAPMIAIAGKDVNVSFAEDIIRIPVIEDDLSVMPVVKAIQLLAYYISVARGLNPDKPTKLTKVVKYH